MTLPHNITAEQSIKLGWHTLTKKGYLELRGSVPGKKNAYKRSFNGRMHVPAEIRAQLDALQLQAQAQWNRPPMDDAHIKARFFVRNRKSDLDNKYVALQDVLVKAGVLVNDSIAHVRSFEASAVVTILDEYVQVTIE
jgi:Holliday junction resolvase RusA-like endonuclease